MRFTTATEQNTLRQKHRSTFFRVKIEDAIGDYRVFNSLDGDNFVLAADWGFGIDDYVASATLTLKREIYGKSISPMVQNSPLNRVDGVYMPVNDIGRRIIIETATLSRGVTEPLESDYRKVFMGEVDTYKMGGGSTVKLVCRDKGGRLVDKWIKEEREYGSDTGVPIVTVAQKLLDDNMGIGVVPLYVVGDAPTFAIKTYKQQHGSLMEALRTLVMLIGWDVRYLWNETAQDFVLTMYEPKRNNNIADWEFGPSDYTDVEDLTIDKFGVRNDFVGKFVSAESKEVVTVYDFDQNSINKYGDQYMGIFEDADSPINTLPEMVALLGAAKSDLKDPAAVQTIDALYFWPAEINDLYDFTPNGRYYDTTQQWAVVNIQHSLSQDGKRRTKLTVRGKPTGGYAMWLRRYGYTLPAEVLGPPVVQLKYAALLAGEDARNTVRIKVDVDTKGRSGVKVWYALGEDDFPDETNINPGDTLVFPRAGNDVRSRVLRVRARTPDGLVDEKLMIIDWNTVAKIVSLNQPYPIKTNGVQTGWEHYGTADPDTHSLLLTFTGAVDVGACVPAAVARAGGGYIVPLGDSLSFVLRYSHALAGTKGAVVITPYGGPNADGDEGEAITFALERKPEPTIQIKELSSVGRQAIISLDPATSKVNWQARLADGALRPTKKDGESATVLGWRTALVDGPTVSFTFDVDPNQDTIIEYYAEANGMRSNIKQQPVDKDNQPELKNFRAQEVAPNMVKVSCNPDDDCQGWALWGAPGAYPRKSNGEPDNGNFLFDGFQQDTETAPFKAQTATWYFIARAYDSAGKFKEHTFALVVAGLPPAVGSLTVTSANTVDLGSGNYHHRIIWSHNAAAGTGHKVRITLDGTQVVTNADNRSPATDYDGTNTASGVGGYQGSQVYPVNASHPRAVYKTYTYLIEMLDGNNALVDADTVNISGYFDGNPGDTDYETPAVAPESLFAYSDSPSMLKCEWDNASTLYAIVLEFEVEGVGSDGSEDVTSGLTYWERGGYQRSTRVRFRARYRNVSQYGPWSEFSNYATISGGNFGGLP